MYQGCVCVSAHKVHHFCLQTRKNCVICFQHLGKKSVDHWHQNPVIWHRGCSLPINNENMKMSLPSHLYDGYLLSSHFILHRVERGSATGGSLVALQCALRFAPFRPDVGETVVGIADQRGTWCLWPGGGGMCVRVPGPSGGSVRTQMVQILRLQRYATNMTDTL